MKKVKVRTTTGRISIIYRKEKPKFAKCAQCGKRLHGVPRVHPIEIGKLTKSEKRPSRAYGGYFCSSCTKDLFREKVRVMG